MPTYRHVCKFAILMHFLALTILYKNNACTFSVLMFLHDSEFLAHKLYNHGNCKRFIPGNTVRANTDFLFNLVIHFSFAVFVTWLALLLYSCGDVHPNPGPLSTASTSSNNSSSSGMSNILFSSLDLTHNLSFVHYNVQSIYSKLEILEAELFEFDILAFTETWLSPSTDTSELLLHSFNTPERKDREHDSHGGVMIYVKDCLHYKRRVDLESRNIESIWIELTNNHKRILFGLFYRPPNSDSNYFSDIEDSVALAVDSPGISEIIITGDFNLNVLHPQTARKINSICTEFSFYQSISQPTHFTENSSSLIDILLVNNKNYLIVSGVGDPFLNQEIRYHCPIYGIFKFSKPKFVSFTRHIWNYDQGNYDLLRNKATSFDWDYVRDNDTNIYANNINTTVTSIAKECIPNRCINVKPSEPPWINLTIKRHIRKRKRAYRKAKRTNSELDWKKFKSLRNKVVHNIRESKKSFYDKIAAKLTSETLSSKDWWSTLKTFIAPNYKTSIPPLEFNDDTYIEENDKANVLNNFFQSHTILNEQNAVIPVLPAATVNTPLSTIVLTPLEVESVLKTLPVAKASGPDGLSNRVLRELSKELSVPYCSLFNQSLRMGIVPSSYKEANVCPVPKTGDLSLVSNYRPISLLNSEDKVLERLVFKHLFNHLRDNNLLSSLQSGFLPGDSTVNQLTYLYNTFCQALDSGKEVRAVFCDISKAFDRVWHAGLLAKLKAAGVSGNIHAWFADYLSDRKQRVVLPGAVSDWTYIRAGVPQGSILGPLLFLLYINDIVNDIGSNIRLFADDTSLFIIVDDPVTAAGCINADLGRISNWASTWLVTFNPSKTETLLISRKLNKPLHPPLFMQNHLISEVDSHKHLGLYFSNDCTWHQHINHITVKAWARINIMRKLKFKLDRKSLETIYTAFIRPLIEYGDIIWDNCSQYEKQELDKIQNEAARIATGATRLVSIRALCKEIGWDSLEKRRSNHKLTLFYKMTHNLAPLYLSSLVPQSVSNISRYNLRNSNNLQTLDARTSLYYNSFLPSTVRAWNNVNDEVKQSDSLNTFKGFLTKDKLLVPKHFYVGHRKVQVLHTRLRTNCSSLNLDLFTRNISDSPLCQCGSVENAQHFFFHCRYYQVPRTELMNTVSLYQNPSLSLLLYGNDSFSLETNTIIFEKVHKFILDSKRF
ncbi:MAG: reverse transcriptase family protein [Candidatus Thiodiazotropha endolucinida]